MNKKYTITHVDESSVPNLNNLEEHRNTAVTTTGDFE